MSNLQNVCNELKILQREVAELRAQRKERRSKAEFDASETKTKNLIWPCKEKIEELICIVMSIRRTQ